MENDLPLLLDVKKTSDFLGLSETATRELMKKDKYPKIWRGNVMYSIKDKLLDYIISIQGQEI